MKIWKVLILGVIIGLMAVPAVSAKGAYAENSDTKVILNSVGKDYIVSPSTENSFDTESFIFLNVRPNP